MRLRDELGRFRARSGRTNPVPTKAPKDLDPLGADILSDPSCWIAPNGDIYFVNDNGGSHSATCRRITDSNDGMMSLEAKNWLHVSFTSIYEGYDSDRGRRHSPTQAQVDAIFDLASSADKYHTAHELKTTNYVTTRFNAWIAALQENPS
jgi:hypothetical protein